MNNFIFKKFYDNTFKDTIFSNIDSVNDILHGSSEQFKEINVKSKSNNSETIMNLIFYNASKNFDSCTLKFDGLNSFQELEPIFKNSKMDNIYTILNLFSDIGKRYRFFNECTIEKNLSIAKTYKKFSGDNTYVSSEFTIGTVHFNPAVYQKSSGTKKFTKTSKITVYFSFSIVNDELVANCRLKLPFTYKEKSTYTINMNTIFNKKEIDDWIDLIEIYFEMHTDYFLRKYFKIKNKELENMTLESKLVYFPLMEMINI